MDQQPRQPTEVILFGATVSPSDFLTLVMDGTGLTIRRNGAVVTGFLYRSNEMEKAIAEFRALVRRVSDGDGFTVTEVAEISGILKKASGK